MINKNILNTLCCFSNKTKTIAFICFALISQSCNNSKKKVPSLVTSTYKTLTINTIGITCTDVQLQDALGKLLPNTDTLALSEIKNLKLFVTGYTPVNGMVNLNGSLIAINADAPFDTLFTKNNYFANTEISNGDARFLNMPFQINSATNKIKALKIKALLTEKNTAYTAEAILQLIVK